MSSSNCCFLTCIQISQGAGQVVWYSHLFQNFPQFIVIHPVKGFDIVNKENGCFSGTLLLFPWSADVGNLISGSSAFLKPAWTSGSSRFTYCWSLHRLSRLNPNYKHACDTWLLWTQLAESSLPVLCFLISLSYCYSFESIHKRTKFNICEKQEPI